MRDGPMLRSDRLLLRRWRDADLEPFAGLNADPQVMEHLPAPLTRAESDTMAGRADAAFGEHGFGLWAVEIAARGEFIGFTGLWVPSFEAHFTTRLHPATEVGWRLARRAWGYGYASEAARAALGFGFREAGLSEIVSFTSPANARSEAVMRRVGMTHDAADDFDHPGLPAGHRLRRHALYRITAAGWQAGQDARS